MKTFFGMTAAVLLVVSLLFVSVPGTAGAAGKVSLTEMVSIKKAADEAMKAATTQAEKAKTAEEKRLAKQLVKQAEINAEVAGDLLEAMKAGEEVSREEAAACAAIAKAVNEAAGALAAGNMAKAEDVLNRIARMSSNLPTAANARAEMQRADGAGKDAIVVFRCPWLLGSCRKEDEGTEVTLYCSSRCNDKGNVSTLCQMIRCEKIMHENKEYFCKNNATKSTNTSCVLGCRDGKCIQGEGEVIGEGEVLACTCTGGGGWALGAPMNPAARFAFDRNCVNGQVVEDSCRYPSPSVPHNCPCPAPAR